MKRLLTVTALMLAATACGQGDTPRAESMPAPAPMADSITVSGVAASRDRKMAPPAGEPVQGQQMLAYEHEATLELPKATLGGVMEAHEAACHAAGPRVCLVLSSQLSEPGESYAYGSLQFRATRAYLDPFREGLAQEAEAADGRLAATATRAEDLSRAITDTAARLEAQKRLRERLLSLLERQTDEVGDLLEVERELARVQGEIESAESYLAILETRVSMDLMTLSYQAKPEVVQPGAARPLTRALGRFVGTMAESLAAVILFIAGFLPWLIVIVPGLWFIRLAFRRWRSRKAS